MLRVLGFLIAVTVLAGSVAWLADRPGSITINWLGYTIDQVPVTLVIGAFILLFAASWLIVWLVNLILDSPGALGGFLRRRRQKRGQEALSKGLVAASAGDGPAARKYASQAGRVYRNDPLAKLLEAQAAQIEGDRERIEDSYKAMLEDPDTEIVALRGLFVQARKSGDMVSARQYAERARRRNPSIPWATEAMTTFESASGNWPAVLKLIEVRRKAGNLPREEADRQRAVVLTAQALEAEDKDNDAALDLAAQAHKLDPSLIPAAAVAGRLYAEQGSIRKSSKVIERTWAINPHPELAGIYAHARAGDSPQDRLKRIDELLRLSNGGVEGAIAAANAAIDAHDWAEARNALKQHAASQPSARVCELMAEIEEGELGDNGRSREWLARALRAPRDPAWTADGHVRDDWLPVSPVTGKLGAFEWKVPVTALAIERTLPEIAVASAATGAAAEPEAEPDIENMPVISPPVAADDDDAEDDTEIEVIEAQPVDADEDKASEKPVTPEEGEDKPDVAATTGTDSDSKVAEVTETPEKPDVTKAGPVEDYSSKTATSEEAEKAEEADAKPQAAADEKAEDIKADVETTDDKSSDEKPAEAKADAKDADEDKSEASDEKPAKKSGNGSAAVAEKVRKLEEDVSAFLNRQPDDPGPDVKQ